MSIFVFIVLDFSFYKVKGYYLKFKNSKENNIENNIDNTIEIKPKEFKETEDNNYEDIWQLEIPKINLTAPIAEGTSQEVMQEFVGHFENTEVIYGNVGLAAHNRGFPINYFSRLKELELGDKIIYKTKFGTKEYKVFFSTIIADTDWTYLQQNTDKNTITLITCVENRPNNRLCIQGVEEK